MPTAVKGRYPNPLFEACLNMNQWPNNLSATRYFGSFGEDVAAADDPTLAACLELLRQQNITFTLEISAIAPVNGCGDAWGCFYNALFPLLQRIRALSIVPIQIRMQEPLTKGRMAYWSDPDIVNNTVTYMALTRDYYPDITFVSVEAYPYNSADSLNWWMRALTVSCTGAGVTPPVGFETDHDAGDGRSRWSDLIRMRDQAHALGWTYGYIFGSPVQVQPNWASNVFYQGMFIGFNPDVYTFESWEAYDPWWMIPEDTSDWTFMHTIRMFRFDGYFPW